MRPKSRSKRHPKAIMVKNDKPVTPTSRGQKTPELGLAVSSMSWSLPILLCSPPRLQKIAPARQIRPRRTCSAPTPFSTSEPAPAMARSGAEPFGTNY